jgi:hypothetical protein
MALPENQIGFSDAVPLEQADVTEDILDTLHGRGNEDVIFWSAIRGAARPPFAPPSKYNDPANDEDLLQEIMDGR